MLPMLPMCYLCYLYYLCVTYVTIQYNTIKLFTRQKSVERRIVGAETYVTYLLPMLPMCYLYWQDCKSFSGRDWKVFNNNHQWKIFGVRNNHIIQMTNLKFSPPSLHWYCSPSSRLETKDSRWACCNASQISPSVFELDGSKFHAERARK